MSVMTKVTTLGIVGAVVCLGAANAAAWWNDDDYHDRWYGGPWYGGYPGYYGWGGYPGYGWGGYPGYGWGGYPGYGWGGYPGYGQGSPSTIIVHPPSEERAPETERQLPR